eukprot:218701-Pleurochrysis_carterae.AAC.2
MQGEAGAQVCWKGAGSAQLRGDVANAGGDGLNGDGGAANGDGDGDGDGDGAWRDAAATSTSMDEWRRGDAIRAGGDSEKQEGRRWLRLGLCRGLLWAETAGRKPG